MSHLCSSLVRSSSSSRSKRHARSLYRQYESKQSPVPSLLFHTPSQVVHQRFHPLPLIPKNGSPSRACLIEVRHASLIFRLSSQDSQPLISLPLLSARYPLPSHSRSQCTTPCRPSALRLTGYTITSLSLTAQALREHTQIKCPVSRADEV